MVLSYTILYLLNHLAISLVRAFSRQKEIFFMSGYCTPLSSCLKKRFLTQVTFTYAAALLGAEALMIWVM